MGTLIVLANSLLYSLYCSHRKFDYLVQFYEEEEATCLEFKFNWSDFFFFKYVFSTWVTLTGWFLWEVVIRSPNVLSRKLRRCNTVLQTALCAEGGNILRFRCTSFHWLLSSLLTHSKKHSSDARRTHKITLNSEFRVFFCSSIPKNLTWWHGFPLQELYIWVHRYNKVLCLDSPRRDGCVAYLGNARPATSLCTKWNKEAVLIKPWLCLIQEAT